MEADDTDGREHRGGCGNPFDSSNAVKHGPSSTNLYHLHLSLGRGDLSPLPMSDCHASSISMISMSTYLVA